MASGLCFGVRERFCEFAELDVMSLMSEECTEVSAVVSSFDAESPASTVSTVSLSDSVCTALPGNHELRDIFRDIPFPF